MFAPDLYAQSVLINKNFCIGAQSEVYQECVVGWGGASSSSLLAQFSQVRKEDPENVLVSSLSYLTGTKRLFGGDLETAVATLRTVASRSVTNARHISVVLKCGN